jgi:hypothetical protein
MTCGRRGVFRGVAGRGKTFAEANPTSGPVLGRERAFIQGGAVLRVSVGLRATRGLKSAFFGDIRGFIFRIVVSRVARQARLRCYGVAPGTTV